MNKSYRELFQMVARNGAINAEKVIDTLKQDKENDHAKEIESMLVMRDSFNSIEDKLLNNKELDKSEYVKLYAGAVVSRNLIKKNIDTWTAVAKEYDDNLIPKLYEVGKEEDYKTLVDEYFN